MEMIFPRIIGASKSLDKCWFWCNEILSRADEYSEADDVLKNLI
jgi:hypothetical protein